MTFLRQLSWRSLGAVVCVGVVLFCATGLLLYRLGAEPLQDYDEATYAEIANENRVSPNPLSFTFLDRNYFRKPPLLFWLMDVSESVVTSKEVGARFPSAFSGVLLVGAVMLVTFEACQNLYVAALAGAILTTTSAFIEPARQARFDVLVSLFCVAAFYAFLRAFRTRWWFVVFGVLLGLAFMTKGPLAIYAVAAVLGASLAIRHVTWIRDPYFWYGVLAFFVVVLPWHIYETVQFGYAFWEDYAGDQVLNRVGQSLFAGPANSDYLGYLFSFAAPWSVLFVVSLILLPVVWKNTPQRNRAVLVGSIVGVAAVLLVCFVTKTKAFTYLIPLYPFMAVTIAGTFWECYRRLHTRSMNILLATSMVLLAVGGAWLAIWNGFHINPYYTAEVTLAQDERAIGNDLLTQQPDTFYEYHTTTLGSIMFYSELLNPLVFDPANPPAALATEPVFVVLPTASVQSLEQQTPLLLFTPIYSGSYVALFQVSRS